MVKETLQEDLNILEIDSFIIDTICSILQGRPHNLDKFKEKVYNLKKDNKILSHNHIFKE